MQATKPDAAIAQATPTSAMQPPSAALIVAPCLNSIPIADAVSKTIEALVRAWRWPCTHTGLDVSIWVFRYEFDKVLEHSAVVSSEAG